MSIADQLTDARSQYHNLMTGQAATVFMDQNGERVEFRPASAPKLAEYIRDLERQLTGHSRPAELIISTSKGLT